MQESGGFFDSSADSDMWALLYLMAFLVAANTLPASGHFHGGCPAAGGVCLPAKMFIKSSVTNKLHNVLCCWERVWQHDVAAHEPGSTVPAGNP